MIASIHDVANTGLSLCIQGTLKRVALFGEIFRFIPVCTGNINSTLKLLKINSVYPCVYREYTGNIYIANVLAGLSLCVQGIFLLKII